MRVKRMVALTLAMTATALAAPQERTAAAGGEDRWLAPVDVQPYGGHDASGVARLTGAAGGPARIIAILIGLHAADAAGDVHLAFGRASCDGLGGAGDLRVLPRPLDIGPDGSARVDRPLPEGVAGARSLAVVGDWDGDGRDGIGACGDLTRLTPAGGNDDADGVLISTRRSTTGDGLILGNLLYVIGQPGFPVVLTSLVAGTTYDVGLSRRPCGATQAQDVHPDIPLLQVVADERGTAYASATDVAVPAGDWRSLVVTPGGGDAVVGCARTDTIEVALAD